ncbi:f-box and wd domain containing protein [Sporothrix brasiliensis 5110]|uniref:F-box and wd domain containing protein n=1 Tax=Sporothrix brasiliensis 5110 TaxID=1398154 RepID=A0A0C2EZ70_9PEZI|nr:f-box and wd domain containing protein [Sporothrix brasiliensis 5110]KIH91789.1 f-box and wd domain containing protein [Sporothrix brasiliensis 5110]
MPLTGGLAPHLGEPAATIVSLQTNAFENDNGHGGASRGIEPDLGLVEHTGGDIDFPVPPHPLGIKPLGNKYLDSGIDAKTAAGVFQAWPDELLMHMLEGLDMSSLRALGSTCRFLYAFCTFDELWKSLALDYTNPSQFARGIPRANQIRRFHDLAYDDFAAAWSDTPFVLAADRCVQSWPVLRSWSLDGLRSDYATTAFRAESVDWPYALYDQYMRRTADESPLYLFDKKFAEKMDLTVDAAATGAAATTATDKSASAYWKPACFGRDLFEVLGPQRPAHRWLIVGPARSGSTFHKDPNGTSAWNAVVRGAKYWILFPPGAAVPGVYVSADKSEVTSPLSIAEWLLTFHAEARATPGCIEGVCREGEILHVPSGWWHLVVNLEAGIALTQNFVPRAHLAEVLLFLRDRPEQVTGFARGQGGHGAAGSGCEDGVDDPYGLFVERLAEQCPDLLADAQAEMARRDARKKRTWESVVRGDDDTKKQADGDADDEKRQKTGESGSGGGGFTFGFGGADDDLEEEIP